jgi:hypothetical protein
MGTLLLLGFSMNKIYYSSAFVLSLLFTSASAMKKTRYNRTDLTTRMILLENEYNIAKALTKKKKTLLKQYNSASYDIIGELMTELHRQSSHFRYMLNSGMLENKPYISSQFQTWYLRVNKALARILIDQRRYPEARTVFKKIAIVGSQWLYESKHEDVEKLNRLYEILQENITAEADNQFSVAMPTITTIKKLQNFNEAHANIVATLQNLTLNPHFEESRADTPETKSIEDNDH